MLKLLHKTALISHMSMEKVRDIVQVTESKTISKKKKCKKAKWLSKEVLQIAVKRREVKSKGENERYAHLNARRHKKAFLRDQCKEMEEKNHSTDGL